MFTLEFLKVAAKRITIVGGIGTLIILNYIPYLQSTNIARSNHYKQAIELLHNHPEAIKFLGEPIKEYKVNTTSKAEYGMDDEKVWVNVPVKGPKDKGKLFYEFPVVEDGSPMKLSKVELTVDKVKNQKLLIKRPD